MNLLGLTYEKDGHRKFRKKSWLNTVKGYAYIGKDNTTYYKSGVKGGNYNNFNHNDDWEEISTIIIGGE